MNYSVAQYLCGADRGQDLLRSLFRYLTVDKPAAVPLLTVRVVSNMFMHDSGAQLNLKHHGEILTRVRETLPIQPKPNQKQALATLLLNYAVATRKYRFISVQKTIYDKLNLSAD